MRRPIRKFFLVSACLHLVFLFLSGFIFVTGPVASLPITVSLIDSEADNMDIPTGKIEALPEPGRIEKPRIAKILSKFDSKAHSPEKGVRHGSKKTAIPREKINPPAPSIKKSKEEEQAAKPKRTKTKISALVEKINDKDKKSAPKEIDTFSREVGKKPGEAEQTPVLREDKRQREQKRRRLSAKTTDQPSYETVKPPQPSGLQKAKGSDMETYARAEADNVIDMGDEAVVSFNTKSFIYFDYFNSIRKQIELEWAYPEEAIIQGWNGRVMLRFTIKKSGELESVRLLKSTGHNDLDIEAQSAIKSAAPYDPFPGSLDKKKIHIVATFVYQPTFSFIK